MKRVDRLMDDCRLLRVHRALRAQKRVASDPATIDWQGECDVAGVLTQDLSETAAPSGEDRLPIDVIDSAVLKTLVPRLVEAIAAVLDAASAETAIVEASMPKLDSYLERFAAAKGIADAAAGKVKPQKDDESEDQKLDRKGRPIPPIDVRRRRMAAMADVAALCVESALFEAVRSTIVARDMKRDVRGLSYVESIRIEDGRVRRKRKPRPLAERGKTKREKATAEAKSVAPAKAVASAKA